MTHRHRDEEDQVPQPPPEQVLIDRRSSAIAEKVAVAHRALEEFLRSGQETNGAR